MSVVQAGQKFSFGVTYNGSNASFVAAKIYDNSGASPVLLSTVHMVNYFGNSWEGSYIAPSVTNLLIQKSAYTDGTYTTFDTNFAQSDETQQVIEFDLNGNVAGSGELIGLILCSDSCSPFQNVFNYYVGDTKSLDFKAYYAKNLVPLDLSACTEIVVNLPNVNGTMTQLLLSSSQVTIATPAILGSASAPLNSTVYASPNVGVAQDLFVTFTIGGNPITVKYPKALNIFQT